MPNLIPMRMIVKISKDETSIGCILHYCLTIVMLTYYDVDSKVWSRASPELELQQQMLPQIYISLAFALHAVNHCSEVFQHPQEESRRV